METYMKLLIVLIALMSCTVPEIRYEPTSVSPETSMEFYNEVSKCGEKIFPHLKGLVIDRVSIGPIQYGVPAVEATILETQEYMAMAVGYPILDMDMRVSNSKNKVIIWDTAQDMAAGVSFTAKPWQHVFILESPNMTEPLGYYYFVLAYKVR
jgi:hypothetical protein